MIVMLALKAYLRLVSACVRARYLGTHDLLADSVASAGDSQSLCVIEEKRAIEFAQRALSVAERAFPIRIGCLQRSLALQSLLRENGIAAQLRIGVRKERTALKAHAWLEYRGELLNSSTVHRQQFEPLHPIAAGNGAK